MSYAAGIFLAVIAVCAAIMMTVQLVEYLRGRSLLTRRHLALRLLTGVLLVGIVAGIYAGVLIRFPSPLAELAYWGSVVVFLGVVILLGLTDLRMLERVVHQRRAQLYRQLAEAEEQLRRCPRKGHEPAQR
jgi:hypothetical protein